MKKKKRIFLLLVPILLIYIMVGLKSNLKITHYEYHNPKLPASFEGFKILQISDLHCKTFGAEQSELINQIHACQPDIIVMTGDIIDKNSTSVKPVYDLIAGLNQQYPIYYVSGNHELDYTAAKSYGDMLDIFRSYRVTLLDDRMVTIQKEDASIRLYGQKFRSRHVVQYLEEPDTEQFNILLYHAGDFFDLIAPFQYDLVFSGHLHGGVIRLPFIGGLFSPDGTLFPNYDKGMYRSSSSTLISGAGLGGARIPRFYNDPELVLVTLHSSAE